MSSKQTERAATLVKQYKKDTAPVKYRHYNDRYIDKEPIKAHAFPLLFSAMFYDPLPDHISYINYEAYRFLYLKNVFYAERIMERASREIPETDPAQWISAVPAEKRSRDLGTVLIFGAAHRNGYLREKCVQHFTDDFMYHTLPSTLIRLNDWVPAVRRAALHSLTVQLRAENVSSEMVDAMPYVEFLRHGQRAERKSGFSMNLLDKFLMQLFGANPQDVSRAKPKNRKLCYKVFALHPDPEYRGLILQFFRNEWNGSLRRDLERIYLQMSGDAVPAAALELFMQDPQEQVRLCAYQWRFRHDGIWEGFADLMLSPAKSIRYFAMLHLKNTGFDAAGFCREHLPQGLCALGDLGDASDIPRIHPYLESHPAEAMTALVKLGAEDGKSLLLRNLQGDNTKLAKAAYHLAYSTKCLAQSDLLAIMQQTNNPVLQYRVCILLTKDGFWNVLPVLIRFLRDFPAIRSDLCHLIWKHTQQKQFITHELAKEIGDALTYAREKNTIPYEINNQILFSIRYC